ncbi:MAG: hypothetical protein ABL921_25930 [Pirellula sp.]
MIRIRCMFEAAICRSELDDYVRVLELSIVGYTEDGEEIVMGRMGAELLQLQAAAEDGQELISICDNHSGNLVDLYTSLFNEDYDLQEEFDIDAATNQVLFLWQSAFHPKLRPYQSSILNTLPDMFGCDCAMVMRRTASDLDDRELVDLGFKRIAGTEYLFRHLGLMNEYSRVHPRGIETAAEFQAFDEDADWITENWDEEF